MRDVIVAELESPERVVAAARRVRELGYRRVEAYTPFPIPELDEVLAIPRSRLPWIVLLGGLTGAGVALLIQWWTNAFDYPLDVGARPTFSIPSDVPIVFETTVLFASFASFLTVLVGARLPRLHDPIFELSGIERTRIDRFFLVIRDAFLMNDDILEAEKDDAMRRAKLLHSIQDDELARLRGALEEVGAVVRRDRIQGEG